MICTPPERDLIVAGATRLVVPGDFWGRTASPGMLIACDNLQPPKRWVDATGPCPTCRDGCDVYECCVTGGGGRVVSWDNLCDRHRDHQGFHDCQGCCLGCIDGRKREALQMECWCAGNTMRTLDLMYCPNKGCKRGLVTFAYATVEVLPVVERDTAEGAMATGPRCVIITGPGGGVWIVDGDRSYTIAVDRVPVPGRDWVVLLDNVELVP